MEQSVYPQFPHDSAESSRSALRSEAPSVTSATCITHWRGESCDYGMAIDALLWRDQPTLPTQPVPITSGWRPARPGGR